VGHKTQYDAKQVINKQIHRVFTKILWKSIIYRLYIQKIYLQSKRSEYLRIHKATLITLNFALSFLRIVRLGSKLLKILMPAYNTLLWKQDRMAFGLCKWCVFLVLVLSIDESKNVSNLLIKFINDGMYWHWAGRISECINRLLHEVLCCAPSVILTILFCKMKIFPLL
jgi:hypothetical protein